MVKRVVAGAKGWIAALLALFATGVAALEAGMVAAFSAAEAGAAPPGAWRELSLPSIKAPGFSLVADGGATVLRIHAAAAAGTLAHSLSASAAERPILAWRWKVDRVVEMADLARKEGDDFAARLYVFFDMPVDELPFLLRAKMKLAKILYGADLPVAALCYVWDNRHAAGTSAWNAYSDRLRMVVVQSGGANAGRWVEESRDVDADFRAAFGATWKRPTPRITGIAVGADTDQTGETVTAWFGDLRFSARR